MMVANGSSGVFAFMSPPSQSASMIGAYSRQQLLHHEVSSALPMGSEPNQEDDQHIMSSMDHHHGSAMTNRRSFVMTGATLAAVTTSGVMMVVPAQKANAAGAGAIGTSNDFIQTYDDFIPTDEGWQYKDVKLGVGNVEIQDGDRVVFDWSGYTIGYFGRPFQAKGGPQGGAFDKELDFSRTVVGSGQMVKGVECALRSMRPGGIRQVVVPYGPLGYPPGKDNMDHVLVGPTPTTFSGMRALNFVLENPRVDRTLLFNIKVIRVDKANGKGGFTRG
jgi:FKBP-type peptidyl-prolyl cis-trans isomerase